MLAMAACLSPWPLPAAEIGLAGVTSTRAMLLVDGGEPQAVAVGQVFAGVRLVALQGDSAVIEIDGRRRSLRVGQHALGAASGGNAGKAVLAADSQGHYYAAGTINDVPVRFLVDTGATLVSLGAAEARRIGLDVGSGQRGITNTANGQAVVSRVKLETVRVGDIILHNIDAQVLPNDMPFALLGMSFLARTEMQRDGNSMTLKKRY